MKLEDLQTNSAVEGILANEVVTVVNARWFGSEALELTYKTATGKFSTGHISTTRKQGLSPLGENLSVKLMRPSVIIHRKVR